MSVVFIIRPKRFGGSSGSTPADARVTPESDVRVTPEGDTRVHADG